MFCYPTAHAESDYSGHENSLFRNLQNRDFRKLLKLIFPKSAETKLLFTEFRSSFLRSISAWTEDAIEEDRESQDSDVGI